ncbi:LysR substrate-binding domain-containing protein [Serratia marcescens]|uniref:LysR substrate-binding domain-containing protein n=1 Tax=Serratia marcescens TaxID=615 RepID=UPI00396C591A
MHLTDLGQQFYQYCQNILIEAQVAEEVILNAHEIPSGLVTISCPELLAKRFLANVIGRFLQQYPQIQIHLVSTNRIVNLFSEGVDIAIRVREKIEDSAYYIAQPVCQVKQLIVASPELISQYSVPHSPQELQSLPFVSTSQRKWVLEDPLVKSNFTLIIDKPKLVSDDLSVLLQVAQQGLGVTILPYPIVLEGLNNGRLVNILPKHIASWGVLHLVYANRLGRTPAAKLLLDFLVQEMRAHFSV